MLNWASRFNICLFLDNHAYRIAPHSFECLLAAGALDELRIPAPAVITGGPEKGPGKETTLFPLLEGFARNNNKDWLFGHVGYGAGRAAEDVSAPIKQQVRSSEQAFLSERVFSPQADRIGFPDLFFFVPEFVIELDMGRMRIGMPFREDHDTGQQSGYPNAEEQAAILFRQILDTKVGDPGPAVAKVAKAEKAEKAEKVEKAAKAAKAAAVKTLESMQSGFTRQEYMQTVDRLRDHILRGDCYEINFCQEFFAEEVVLDPVAVYLALSEASPTPFGAFYKLEDRYLFCASPERYLARQGRRLLSQPIKGTAPRDLRDPQQDILNKETLYHSEKDRSENVMIVDLVRNDLSRVCLPGSVRVDELYGIYSFPQVHQMISTISGELAPDMDLADCLRETFPMGSMTGAPKKRVMELIAQYERSSRGLFSGAVGYVLPGGDFDFNVVIRSIFYNGGTRRLSYQVGSAITFNSDPEKEYEECMLKAEGIRKALGI